MSVPGVSQTNSPIRFRPAVLDTLYPLDHGFTME